MKGYLNKLFKVLTLQSIVLLLLFTITQAQPMSGDALVIDPDAGTNFDGALFSVDLFTGFRTTISDFGDAGQGLNGRDPNGLVQENSNSVLVTDDFSGGDGLLFRVNLTTGDRQVISDFGDAGQGPLGEDPNGVTLEDSNNALVTDRDGGTSDRGQLFRVNLSTGDRQVVSDFGDAGQGTLGFNPTDVALEDANNALVSDPQAGVGNSGLLFRVNLTTGDREVVSAFGDPLQGPTFANPTGLAL